MPGVKLVDPTPGVATRIGGVIPSAVEHDAPAHELSAGVVRESIVIEEVGECEAADGDAIAVHRTRTAELILVAVDGFAFAAEAEILGHIDTRDVRFWSGGSNAGKFAVGGGGDAIDATEAAA